jgi:hypothetical protein
VECATSTQPAKVVGGHLNNIRKPKKKNITALTGAKSKLDTRQKIGRQVHCSFSREEHSDA